MDNLDRDWQFRISVYYAGDEDTNVFKCKTPRGRENSVNVVVTGKNKRPTFGSLSFPLLFPPFPPHD